MSIMAYRPTVRVTMLDDADGVPMSALSFTPTPTAMQRLAERGLLFRGQPWGFRLVAALAGTGLRRPIRSEVTLSFAIRLADPGFLQRFRPALSRTAGVNLYLTNRTSATQARSDGKLTSAAQAGTAEAARITGLRFSATGPAGGRLVLATAFAPPRALPDVEVPASTVEVSVQVDLARTNDPLRPQKPVERVFTMTPTPPGSAPVRIVADDDLAGQGAFGLLDLVLKPLAEGEPAGGRIFTARFRRQP